jgi:SAM-dependent methyltransferase
MPKTGQRTTRRTVLGLCGAVLSAYGQPGSSSPEEWKDFLAWAAALEPELFPPTGSALFAAYRTKLIREGVAPATADAIAARVQKAAQNSQPFSSLFYNKTYSKANPGFSSNPNPFLVEVVEKLRPGRALDLGMGEGRNALFLAQRGWNVTGIDLAEVGIAKAKKRAEALGLQLTALVQDANQFDFGHQQWDLVCMLYFSGFNFVQDLEKRTAAGLTMGGHVLFEGPVPSPDRLLERWHAWDPWGVTTLRLEYSAEKADWGQPSLGRLLLQKSNPK